MTALKNIHTYICEHKNWDSDFWDFVGNDKLVSLLNELSFDEWEELKREFRNWASDELYILGDAITYPSLKAESQDINEIYLRIFNIVEDSEADYLIQNLHLIEDGKEKPIELLEQARQRIMTLQLYTLTVHNVHDYQLYFNMIDRLIENSRH